MTTDKPKCLWNRSAAELRELRENPARIAALPQAELVALATYALAHEEYNHPRQGTGVGDVVRNVG